MVRLIKCNVLSALLIVILNVCHSPSFFEIFSQFLQAVTMCAGVGGGDQNLCGSIGSHLVWPWKPNFPMVIKPRPKYLII